MTFQCDPPTGDAIGGHDLAPIVLKLGAETMSFEVLCNHLEQRFCDADIDLIVHVARKNYPIPFAHPVGMQWGFTVVKIQIMRRSISCGPKDRFTLAF